MTPSLNPSWFIEIDDKHRSYGHVLGAILAHERCHILFEERVHNLSEDARIVVGAALLLVAAPASLWLHGELSRAPLGGPCARDTDCHSGL